MGSGRGMAISTFLLALVILSDVAHCNGLASCEGVANAPCCEVIADYIKKHKSCNALCSEVGRYSYRITNEMIKNCWETWRQDACKDCKCG